MVYGDFNGPRQRKNKPNSNPNKANFKCQIGRGLDSRLRGNDKYGIPARWKILTPFEKTKPIFKWPK